MRLSSGAAAASAVAALLLVPTAALAADTPTLTIFLAQRSEIGVSPNPITPTFLLSNVSQDVVATGVTLTVSLAGLTNGVRLDGIDPACSQVDAVTVRCPVHDLDTRGSNGAIATPIRLVAPDATAVAPAGPLSLTLDSAEGGAITRAYPVHTVPRGTDVELTSEPVGPSGPGQTLDLPLTATNHGPAIERTRQLTLTVPRGIALGDRNREAACRWSDGGTGQTMHWGPVTVVCPFVEDIEPGESNPILEGGSSPARFISLIGKDTPGPFTYLGRATLQIVNHDDQPANNTAPLSVTAIANRLDVAVKVKAGADSVTWTVVNHGPSAATGWTADLTAPAGTTFRPAQGCTATGSTTLRCTSTDWVAPGKSVARTVRLDGTATPEASGSITISGTGPSAESDAADNQADFTLGSDSGTGGQGGGLPITGPSAIGYALGAVGVVLLGALLLFVGRRRGTPEKDAR